MSEPALADAVVASLESRASALAAQWRARAGAPFSWVIVDDLLPGDMARALAREFPAPDAPSWERRTFIHQSAKLTQRTALPDRAAAFFAALGSPAFLRALETVTGIQALQADPELIGGGLHQIQQGGFLDVHVDYNLHPTTKLHRRLNLLVYLNEGWLGAWGGQLELWDMREKRCIERVVPVMNRAVLFETNEVSFHGHPEPVHAPRDVARRSLAAYYYTDTRDDVAPEHNTVYVNTTGAVGVAKSLRAGTAALAERVREGGAGSVAKNVLRRAARKLRGLPPENR